MAHPEAPLSHLPLLRPDESIDCSWNGTPPGWTIPTTSVSTSCLKRRWTDPDAIAVLYEDQYLTYRELNRRANQVAHYLQTLGVGAEVLVGLWKSDA